MFHWCISPHLITAPLLKQTAKIELNANVSFRQVERNCTHNKNISFVVCFSCLFSSFFFSSFFKATNIMTWEAHIGHIGYTVFYFVYRISCTTVIMCVSELWEFQYIQTDPTIQHYAYIYKICITAAAAHSVLRQIWCFGWFLCLYPPCGVCVLYIIHTIYGMANVRWVSLRWILLFNFLLCMWLWAQCIVVGVLSAESLSILNS